MKQSFFYRLISSIALCILVIGFGVILIPARAQAYTTSLYTPREVAASTATTNHVTVMVLDMSGSMAQNDPNAVRCSAAKAYIDLSGPGSFIGVIGLDNSGSHPTGGPHNFQLAQIWQTPVEMNTLRARQTLQQEITQKSNNCSPDSTTPTYDALNQALSMLSSATNGGQISGSVILLTDGVPDNGYTPSDTQQQIDAINTDLIPQFKAHNWPIDTIALGRDTSFHGFLGNIANATSGSFYDEGKGVVSSYSPLNIAPFFVDIFAKRNGRTVKNDIPVTQLNGGSSAYNFTVTPYTNNLDVVVVKDQASTTVSMRDSNNQVVHSGAGIFVSSTDPYYVIYSIDAPKEGTWELDINGSGNFLMDSLKTSNVSIGIGNISQANLPGSTENTVLPLNVPITVKAFLTSNGQPITDDRFTLTGTITYTGGFGQYSQQFAMNDKNTPGTYEGNVTVPDSAPPGSYTVHIDASGASAADVIAGTDKSIRIQLFPEPEFLDAKNQPTVNTVPSTVTEWDTALRIIYGVPLWANSWLSQLPLQNLPAVPNADVMGQIELQGQPYNGEATVTATATRVGSKDNIPVTVINDGQGRFHVLFQPLAAGTYNVNFLTSGSFESSHGDFGLTSRTVQLIIQPASGAQELHAWEITALYLLLLVILYYLLRFYITPKPFGEWVRSYEGDIAGRYGFDKARRGPRQWFFHRDLLFSKQANMPKGLQLRFRHGGGIQVRPDGAAGEDWFNSGGGNLRSDFQEVRELVFRPQEDEAEPSTYTIFPKKDRRNVGEEVDEDDNNNRSSRGSSRRDFEDEEDRGSKRGRRQARDEDDEYENRSRRNRKQAGHGRRSSRDEDDYDYE